MFTNQIVPPLICFMQLIGALGSEFINFLMLTTRVTVSMTLTFFVAFHVLIEIDHIYSEALSKNSGLLHVVHEPLKVINHKKDISWRSRTRWHRFIRIIYKLLRYLYISVYYYFIPYIVTFIPFVITKINTEVVDMAGLFESIQ